MADDESCPVCLDTMTDESVRQHTGCEHRFHEECLTRWLTERPRGGCPVCRSGAEAPRAGTLPRWARPSWEAWMVEATPEGCIYLRCPRTGQIEETPRLLGGRYQYVPGATWIALAHARFPGSYTEEIREQQAASLATRALATHLLSAERVEVLG